MHPNEEATAAAVTSPKSALSWQAAHPYFKATQRGAQIHAAHLAHLQRAACIALATIAILKRAPRWPKSWKTLTACCACAGRAAP